MKRCAGALALVVVTSCSGLKQVPYSAPTSGPVASVTFENGSSELTLDIAYFVNSTGCSVRRHVTALPPQGKVTTVFPAGAEVTFQYYLADRWQAQFCLTNIRFSPKAGARYGFGTKDYTEACYFAMQDITDPEHPQNVETKKIPWHNGWDENSSFCDL